MTNLSDLDLLEQAHKTLCRMCELRPYDEDLRDTANAVAFRVMTAPLVAFEWECGRFYIDGRPVTEKTSKGLLIAWVVLALHQHAPDDCLRVEWLGMSTSDVNHALARAADRLERYSRPLAGAVRSVGVKRGEMVVRGVVPRIAFAAPTLVEIIRQSSANFDTA